MIPASFLRRQYRLIPDRVTTTYRAQTSLGTYASGVSVADCWWRAGGTLAEAAPSDGVYVKDQRLWYFPKSAYASVPAVGDLLVSPGVAAISPVSLTWTVLATNDVGALGAWELTCISLQLQANLRGTLTFTRPDGSKDTAGRPAPTYSSFAADVPARVQPEDGAAEEVFSRITMPRRFTAFLGTRVAVRAKDKATDDAGTIYTVVSSEMPERLDELQRVSLESIL